jgi:hypothetical protein
MDDCKSWVFHVVCSLPNLQHQHKCKVFVACCIVSQNIIKMIKSRRLRWVGHTAHRGNEKCIQNSCWEIWRDHLGRCRCGWEDDVKMNLSEAGLDDVLIHLAQDRNSLMVVSCEHSNEPTFLFHIRQRISWLAECIMFLKKNCAPWR